MFSVNYWGSHPDNENDDCWTGEDFDDLAAARAYFNARIDSAYCIHCTEYIELTGPDVYEVRRNPDFRAERAGRDDCDWKRECAMQSAMAFGCDGYNDYYG